MADPRKAIVFVAWGAGHVRAVFERCDWRRLNGAAILLITDRETPVPKPPPGCPQIHVQRQEFTLPGLCRKAEVFESLPTEFESFLFLDTDTCVVDDVSLGFEKARQYGIAISPAPHYSLDHFGTFGRVLAAEGITPCGQLQFNTGVIFFSLRDEVKRVFALWKELARQHKNLCQNDQPYLTLAMEKLGFNPYTLSRSYNYRGMGEPISGVVRVWHSENPPPKGLNDFSQPWPPRAVVKGRVIHPKRPIRKRLRDMRDMLSNDLRRVCSLCFGRPP